MTRPRNDDFMPKERHAPGPHEHSLCGLAPEAYETGDHEEPVIFAKPGELIRCDACRIYLDHVRDCFKGYRFTA